MGIIGTDLSKNNGFWERAGKECQIENKFEQIRLRLKTNTKLHYSVQVIYYSNSFYDLIYMVS